LQGLAVPRRSSSENDEVREYIRALYKQSGYTSWAAFARAAEVSEFSLSEWRSGRGTPQAASFLKILRAAGALAEPTGAERPDAPEGLAARLEAIEATVETSGKETTKALRALTRAIERLPTQLGQSAPGAKPGRAAR